MLRSSEPKFRFISLLGLLGFAVLLLYLNSRITPSYEKDSLAIVIRKDEQSDVEKRGGTTPEIYDDRGGQTRTFPFKPEWDERTADIEAITLREEGVKFVHEWNPPKYRNYTFPKKRRRSLRVVCIVMKNERAFLKDWIDFHLLAGWNRFVFYDHESTDNPLQILNQYPPSIVDYIKVDPNVGVSKLHRVSGIQLMAYADCLKRYWLDAQIIGNFDVDEFLFPGREHMADPDPFLSAMNAMNAYRPGLGVAVSTRMEFYRFGPNGHIKSPVLDVAAKYTKRAAYLDEEVKAAPITQEMKDICAKMKVACKTRWNRKWLYFPNDQVDVIDPMVHHSTGPQIRKDMVNLTRTRGIVCNHIWLRSLDHIRLKGGKNGNGFYDSISRFPLTHPLYQFFEVWKDTTAADFLQRARQRYDLSSPKFWKSVTEATNVTLFEWPPEV